MVQEGRSSSVHRRRGGRVAVVLESNDPAVRLYRGPAFVCAAPCELDLDASPGEPFRIRHGAYRMGPPFYLHDGPETVVLHAHVDRAPSLGGLIGGGIMTGVGGVSAVLGLVFTIALSATEGGSARAAGWVVSGCLLGGGVALGVGGVYTLVRSSGDYTVDVPGMEPRSAASAFVNGLARGGVWSF